MSGEQACAAGSGSNFLLLFTFLRKMKNAKAAMCNESLTLSVSNDAIEVRE
jgi:hypothetical protein